MDSNLRQIIWQARNSSPEPFRTTLGKILKQPLKHTMLTRFVTCS